MRRRATIASLAAGVRGSIVGRTCTIAVLIALAVVVTACSRDADKTPAPGTARASAAAPSAPAAAPSAAASPRREALAGGPYPSLFIAAAQFTDVVGADGKKTPVPGAAKLLIVRHAPEGWKTVTLEDPQSNAFHKAMPYRDGVLTIGASEARLKVWRFVDGAWRDETHWNPTFGGKFNRLRDIEIGDVDGDGDDLVIATHDQGVVAIVHPDQDWRVEQIDQQKDTFVHEIEIGDLDGDGKREIFATPSKPNKLEEEQAGEVAMYERAGTTWKRSVVDAPGDTHAKEILAADVDGDGKSELYVVWEGAIGAGGTVVRPVTIKQYRRQNGAFTSTVVATIPDRQMRALAAGDVNGDGKIDLVGGAMTSGVWLFEQPATAGAPWTKTSIDTASSGFEHPVHLADLDGDGKLEIYVAAEDQHELREYRWNGSAFDKQVLAPLPPGDIIWNVTSGRL